MCCIEAIKSEITLVHKRSVGNIKEIDSIDTMLDKISSFQRGINELSSKINELYDMLYDFMPCVDRDVWNEIGSDMNKLIRSLVSLHAKCKKSDLYSGIRTCSAELKHSIDSLQEIKNDIIVFKLELPEDDEYKSIVSEINKL